MCCFFAILVFLGPRAAIALWWLFDPNRWSTVYGTFIFPALGFIFLPWTTLMYTAVWHLGGLQGWDWLWIGLAVLVDLASYGGSGYGNRNQIPGMRGMSGGAGSGTSNTSIT